MATASPMTGSLMDASQPFTQRGISGHQAETAKAERKVENIKHGSAPFV
jgi:hypothetical protein